MASRPRVCDRTEGLPALVVLSGVGLLLCVCRCRASYLSIDLAGGLMLWAGYVVAVR